MKTTAAPNSLENLPGWARQLSEKYYSRTLSMFVLHGNVHDLVAWKRETGVEYVPLPKFLNEGLFGRRDLVLSYDRGGGLSFGSTSGGGEGRGASARSQSGYRRS